MIVIVGVAIVLGESLDFMKLLGCGIGKCSGPICLYIIIIFVVFPLFFDHFSNLLSSLLFCVLLLRVCQALEESSSTLSLTTLLSRRRSKKRKKCISGTHLCPT